MTTLRVEHAITDLATWLGAFNRFAEARQNAGVTAQRVDQPVDDDRYLFVDLEFDDVEHAGASKRFLETVVWASPESSPGLDGRPEARILTRVEVRAT